VARQGHAEPLGASAPPLVSIYRGEKRSSGLANWMRGIGQGEVTKGLLFIMLRRFFDLNGRRGPWACWVPFSPSWSEKRTGGRILAECGPVASPVRFLRFYPRGLPYSCGFLWSINS